MDIADDNLSQQPAIYGCTLQCMYMKMAYVDMSCRGGKTEAAQGGCFYALTNHSPPLDDSAPCATSILTPTHRTFSLCFASGTGSCPVLGLGLIRAHR